MKPGEFMFDGGLALRCETCGWRFYAGPWDLTDGFWAMGGNHIRWGTPIKNHRRCYLCGGEMVATHRGTADDWEALCFCVWEKFPYGSSWHRDDNCPAHGNGCLCRPDSHELRTFRLDPDCQLHKVAA
jgi:hypothetical protein